MDAVGEREDQIEEAGKTSLESQTVYVLAVFAGLVAGVASALGGPKAASIIVDLSILAYALLVSREDVRLLALASMLGAHAGAVISYYSNPLLIPPVAVLERKTEGLTTRYSLNIDIVSLIAVYDILSRLYHIGEAVEAEETLKAPSEGNPSDMGPEEPR